MSEAVVLSLSQHKGGATKTSTVASLAAVFADEGYRVLVVDNDPQGHLSLQFGIDALRDELPATVTQLYMKASAARSTIVDTTHRGVQLIPASIDLAELEMSLPGMQASDLRLRLGLEPLLKDYDLIVLDSPPNLGKLASNVLAASDYFLVPVDGAWALRSVDTLVQVAANNATFYKLDNKFLGIFLTMYDRTKIMQAVRDEAEARWPNKLFDATIRRSTTAREAAAYQVPLPIYAADSAVAQDYVNLAAEVLQRMGFRGATGHGR